MVGEGGPGEVEAAAVDERAAVVDPHRHRLAVGRVGHPDLGVERQCLVRGGQRVGVERLAVGGQLSVGVERGAARAALQHLRRGSRLLGGRLRLRLRRRGALLAPGRGLRPGRRRAGGRGRRGAGAALGAGELGVRLLATVVGVRSRAVCPDWSEPDANCTAPTVPPTARATPTAAVATMPAGEEKMRVRECLAATGPVLSSSEQTGSDRNERSTSEVNVIMVVCPYLHRYV